MRVNLEFGMAGTRRGHPITPTTAPLGFASEQEARTHLSRLRTATHDFVAEWVLDHKDPIMKLAILLQEKLVGDKRWELSGLELHQAIQRCWGRLKPPAQLTQPNRLARVYDPSQLDQMVTDIELALNQCGVAP